MSALYDTYGPEGTERYGIPQGTVLDCGDTVGHQYKPRSGVNIQDPGTWICECGEKYGADHGIGTGYAGAADTREMICYRHAEDREAAAFAAADTFTAYATALHGDGSVREMHRRRGTVYEPALGITTWTGRVLARVSEFHDGRGHPSGGTMRYLRAVALDGSRWHGRYMPDWSELVTLRRAKGGRS